MCGCLSDSEMKPKKRGKSSDDSKQTSDEGLKASGHAKTPDYYDH